MTSGMGTKGLLLRLLLAGVAGALAFALAAVLQAEGLSERVVRWLFAFIGFGIAAWFLFMPLTVRLARLLIGAGVALAYVPGFTLTADSSSGSATLVVNGPGALLCLGLIAGGVILVFINERAKRPKPEEPTAVAKELRGIQDRLSDLVVESTGANTDIDDAVTKIEAHRYEVALAMLRKVKDQRWAKLTNKDRYRVLANIGVALLKLGEEQEAIDALEQAYGYNREGKKARILKALATWVRGNKSEAVRLSEALRLEYPDAPIPTLIWAQEADASVPHDEIASGMPECLPEGVGPPLDGGRALCSLLAR